MVNVGKYTIHGSYGKDDQCLQHLVMSSRNRSVENPGIPPRGFPDHSTRERYLGIAPWCQSIKQWNWASCWWFQRPQWWDVKKMPEVQIFTKKLMREYTPQKPKKAVLKVFLRNLQLFMHVVSLPRQTSPCIACQPERSCGIPGRFQVCKTIQTSWESSSDTRIFQL